MFVFLDVSLGVFLCCVVAVVGFPWVPFFRLYVITTLSGQHTNSVNNLGSQNVLEVNEPVLMVRPDDSPIGPKHVALYVLLII